MIDWIVRRPWSRRHPGLSGLLFIAMVAVVVLIVMPPASWLLGHLLGWLLRPLGQALMWWFRLWGGGA